MELSEEDIFPPKLLKVARENGGTIVGAFDPAGKLVGFAVNFPGYRYGQLIEWSYLLGVAPESSGYEIAKQLKLAQRDDLLKHGSRVLCWGFDPLNSNAARSSLHELGAICNEYSEQFPDPLSNSSRGQITSEQLIAVWQLNDPRVINRLNSPPPDVEIPKEICLIDPRQLDSGPPHPGKSILERKDNRLAFPIPLDFYSYEQRDEALAKRWRKTVRIIFQNFFSKGYIVEDFIERTTDQPGWGWYELRRRR